MGEAFYIINLIASGLHTNQTLFPKALSWFLAPLPRFLFDLSSVQHARCFWPFSFRMCTDLRISNPSFYYCTELISSATELVPKFTYPNPSSCLAETRVPKSNPQVRSFKVVNKSKFFGFCVCVHLHINIIMVFLQYKGLFFQD